MHPCCHSLDCSRNARVGFEFRLGPNVRGQPNRRDDRRRSSATLSWLIALAEFVQQGSVLVRVTDEAGQPVAVIEIHDRLAARGKADERAGSQGTTFASRRLVGHSQHGAGCSSYSPRFGSTQTTCRYTPGFAHACRRTTVMAVEEPPAHGAVRRPITTGGHHGVQFLSSERS
jgi:hypothetical protein